MNGRRVISHHHFIHMAVSGFRNPPIYFFGPGDKAYILDVDQAVRAYLREAITTRAEAATALSEAATHTQVPPADPFDGVTPVDWVQFAQLLYTPILVGALKERVPDWVEIERERRAALEEAITGYRAAKEKEDQDAINFLEEMWPGLFSRGIPTLV